MDFATRLRTVRRRHKVSQEALAAALGLHPHTLIDIEAERIIPDPPTRKLLTDTVVEIGAAVPVGPPEAEG